MSGRGRGATLPAWMTLNVGDSNISTNDGTGPYKQGQFEDHQTHSVGFTEQSNKAINQHGNYQASRREVIHVDRNVSSMRRSRSRLLKTLHLPYYKAHF